MQFLKIKKITKIGKKRSIDLVVPGNNNFVLANGILSHNSGKSVGMRTLCEKYHDHPDRNYKIVHLWGGDRFEQYFWALPSQDTNYWAKVKKKLRLEEDGPKQYKVNFLYPMSRKLPNKLPQKAGYVKSKVFTIPIKQITIPDISLAIGTLSPDNIYLWKEALEHMKKGDDGEVLKEKLTELKGTSKHIYKSFTVPLVRDGILQGDKYDTNLDLLSELRDRDTITVLCLDYVDKELRMFYIGWIIRQIGELLDAGKVRKIISPMQEVGEFFRVTDQSVVEDNKKIFKAFLAQSIRMGRRGFHLFLDTQSPAEVRGIVAGAEDLTIIGKLPGEADREAACDRLYKDNLIEKKQIADIAVLDPGQYYFVESGKKAKKRYVLLPSSAYWKPGYGAFMSIWERLVGEWHDISPIKESIFSSLAESRKKIDDKKAIENALAEGLDGNPRRFKNTNTQETEDDSETQDEESIPEPEEQNIYTPKVIISNSETPHNVSEQEPVIPVSLDSSTPAPPIVNEIPIADEVPITPETPKIPIIKKEKPKLKLKLWNK